MKLKNNFFMLVPFVSLIISIGFITVNVNADSTENLKKSNDDTNDSIKFVKKVLKSKFNDYIDAVDNANIHNSIYGNGDVYTESFKIPLEFYSSYPKKMKKIFPTRGVIDTNSAVLASDVSKEPWINENGNNLLQILYGNDHRTIYYHINATGKLADLYNAAIQGWNGLGVINLVPAPNNYNAMNVVQLDDSKPSLGTEGALGVAYHTKYQNLDKMTNCSLTLIDDVVNNYSDYAALAIAEHEIGHVLGFNHFDKVYSYARGDKMVSLMNTYRDVSKGKSSVDSYYSSNLVGAREQHKLMQMYNLSVMPGYYVYPEVNSINDKIY